MVYQVAAYVAPRAVVHADQASGTQQSVLDHTVALALQGDESTLHRLGAGTAPLGPDAGAAWARQRLHLLIAVCQEVGGQLPTVALPRAIVDLGKIAPTRQTPGGASDLDVHLITAPGQLAVPEQQRIAQSIRAMLRSMAIEGPVLVAATAGPRNQTPESALRIPSPAIAARTQDAAAHLFSGLGPFVDQLGAASHGDAVAVLQALLQELDTGRLRHDYRVLDSRYCNGPHVNQSAQDLRQTIGDLKTALDQGLQPTHAQTLLQNAIAATEARLNGIWAAEGPVGYEVIDEFYRPDRSTWPLAVATTTIGAGALSPLGPAFWSDVETRLQGVQQAPNETLAATRLDELQAALGPAGGLFKGMGAVHALDRALVHQELFPLVAEQAQALKDGSATVQSALAAIRNTAMQVRTAVILHAKVGQGTPVDEARLLAAVESWSAQLQSAVQFGDVDQIRHAIEALGRAQHLYDRRLPGAGAP